MKCNPIRVPPVQSFVSLSSLALKMSRWSRPCLAVSCLALPYLALSIAVLALSGCDNPSADSTSPQGQSAQGATNSVETTASQAAQKTPAEPSQSESRTFKLIYGATIQDLPEGAEVRVWIPIPESNGQQTVQKTAEETPAKLSVARDKKYGNQIGYFSLSELTAQRSLDFSMEYLVVRKAAGLDRSEKELAAENARIFLSANRLVPTSGKPAELLADRTIPTDPMEAGQMLYDLVESHMKYDKTKPGYGQGDSVWACDSQTGNCTDFHSLFISLARNQHLPARFEIGFPIPEGKSGKIGGYHCWAWFHVANQGWLPVDISEADKNPVLKSYFFGNLHASRVAFSTGRDIELVPAAKSEALNYFIYPHVEVNGKLWPKDKISLKFSYQDQAQ